MYKSTDGGETFFGPNSERGVFKTSAGGVTWNHVLSVDENTGATDLVIDTSNPFSTPELKAPRWSPMPGAAGRAR